MKIPTLLSSVFIYLASMAWTFAKSTEFTKIFKHAALSKLHKKQEYYTNIEQKYVYLEDEIGILEKQFNGKYMYKNIKLMFKFQHIFGITKNSRGIFTGFHHDYLNFYYHQGLLEKIESSHKHGYYQAIPVWCAYKNAKSFFPADWPRQKVIEHILESIENAAYENEHMYGKRIAVTAQTQEGMHIRTIIEKNTGQVITAYPLI